MKRWSVLLLLLAVPAFAGNALAVLPFKNLNADPATDWLKLGIAETMVADLKKSGHTMVERDQVDKALAELALQGQKLDEDSRAAKAGKLMGAASVVVGGYQKAGDQLRITARFVSVETGVVERTAKVTGAMADVFSLQDQVVGELLKGARPQSGGQVKGHTPPPRRPATEKTLKAYQTYAMAMASSSQAERVEKLQEALELDPGFTYASDDLKALRERLTVYEQTAIKATDEAGKKLLAELKKPELSVQDKNTKAMQYLSSLNARRRWSTVLEEAPRIYAMKIPPAEHINVHEQASYYHFVAAMMMVKRDLALQIGERHLKEFPTGLFSGGVETWMKQIIGTLQDEENKRKEYPEALAKLEGDLKAPRNDQARINGEFRRCILAIDHFKAAETESLCPPFIDKAQDKTMTPIAGYRYAMYLSGRGDFARARTVLTKTVKDYPEWARSTRTDVIMDNWPQ